MQVEMKETADVQPGLPGDQALRLLQSVLGQSYPELEVLVFASSGARNGGEDSVTEETQDGRQPEPSDALPVFFNALLHDFLLVSCFVTAHERAPCRHFSLARDRPCSFPGSPHPR